MNALDLDRPAPEEGCLSDLALDQLLTREIGGSLVEQARRAHLAQCGPCGKRLRELEEDAAALLARRPTLALPPGVRRGLGTRAWALGTVGAGAAAAVVLLILRPPSPVPSGDVRLKGSPVELEVYARGGDGRVATLLAGGVAHPGDALRFRVTARRAGYVGIVSVDGRGAVTAYAPDAPSLLPVTAGASRLIDGSVVLDQVLGREDLLVFLCDDRLSTSRLAGAVAAAPEARRFEPGPDSHFRLACARASFWFTKVSPP